MQSILALFGFTLMENGADGINVGKVEPWCASGIYKVIYGLFVSPFIALFWGLLVYFLIYKFAVSNGHPRHTRQVFKLIRARFKLINNFFSFLPISETKYGLP